MVYSPTISDNDATPWSRFPFGALAYFGAGASLFVCYGKVVILGVLSAFGFAQLDFNPHLQALLMWMLGVIAIFGLYRDLRCHGKRHPLILGAVGVCIIIATLYTDYSPTLEVSGYILLVVAALLNQNARLMQLNREVEDQATLLSQQASELAHLNLGLEQRVDSQGDEIEKLARLKQFLAPEVAQIVLAEQQVALLESHRCYIVALFCDIRDFTRFSESMEPEEVMDVLQAYHENMGRLVAEHGGTIDHRAGDGLMIFFNDPIPCDEPEMKAIGLALAMRERFNECNRQWRKQGYQLGFGIGIAAGYATLGVVGYQDRYDYTANGNVVNLASRLCDEAGDGQILISSKTYIAVEEKVDADRLGELELKGIAKPVSVYDLKSCR
ncbi:MAG: adenylate/guanylate cyclase domain-containing protein [Gammaproteobacteria bacterium]|jgi:class 3 adenylate cyclase|nr:adenylate/guanylate cyclase domain-containing protein [Gammaproteobacteria bacterium]